MKTAFFTLAIICILSACKANETPSNTGATSTPVSNANSAGNSNQPVKPVAANSNTDGSKSSPVSDSAKAKPTAPQLIGTYESREVHSEGVVTVISKLKTIWVFSAQGSYSRVSQVNGQTYHSDNGMFSLEAPDKLVLTIQSTGQNTKRKIQNPPVIKTHKYTLSPDGEELRLINDKGAVGIFQRVARPNSS